MRRRGSDEFACHKSAYATGVMIRGIRVSSETAVGRGLVPFLTSPTWGPWLARTLLFDIQNQLTCPLARTSPPFLPPSHWAVTARCALTPPSCDNFCGLTLRLLYIPHSALMELCSVVPTVWVAAGLSNRRTPRILSLPACVRKVFTLVTFFLSVNPLSFFFYSLSLSPEANCLDFAGLSLVRG